MLESLKPIILEITCVFLFFGACSLNSVSSIKQPTYKLQNIKLGISFPPVKDSNEIAFSYKKLKELNVKQIRFAENWKDREPAKGQFNWGPLDIRINQLCQDSLDFIVTVQSDAPAWIKSSSTSYNDYSTAFSDSNNADFAVYLDSLLQRYRGKIKTIQFGNEWQNIFWYSGTQIEFTVTQNLFYTTVKHINSEISVVLGGISIDALRALAASQGLVKEYRNGNGDLIDSARIQELLQTQEAQNYLNRITYVLNNSQYDIIDIHLYDDPENWRYYFSSIKAIKQNIPIVVSEFGGPNTKWNTYSDEFHDRELVRYIKALDSIDISYALYFQLVENQSANHEKSGLITEVLQNKPGYYTFSKICQPQ
jgi:hypothetical protein